MFSVPCRQNTRLFHHVYLYYYIFYISTMHQDFLVVCLEEVSSHLKKKKKYFFKKMKLYNNWIKLWFTCNVLNIKQWKIITVMGDLFFC